MWLTIPIMLNLFHPEAEPIGIEGHLKGLCHLYLRAISLYSPPDALEMRVEAQEIPAV